jgi:hypothetical protein
LIGIIEVLKFMQTSRFTDRVTSLQAEGAYAVLARAQELEAQGKRIIHLEIGQPDFPTPEHVCAAGIQAMDGKTKYTPAGCRVSPNDLTIRKKPADRPCMPAGTGSSLVCSSDTGAG